MKRIVSLLCVVSASAVVTPVCRGDETIACPRRAEVAEGVIAASSVPTGFELLVEPRSVLLSGVSVFDGHPRDGASLKPNTASANGLRVKWVLDGASERGTWVSCDYADGLVRLVRRLGQPVSVCTATLKRSGSPRLLEASFRCTSTS